MSTADLPALLRRAAEAVESPTLAAELRAAADEIAGLPEDAARPMPDPRRMDAAVDYWREHLAPEHGGRLLEVTQSGDDAVVTFTTSSAGSRVESAEELRKHYGITPRTCRIAGAEIDRHLARCSDQRSLGASSPSLSSGRSRGL